MTGQQEAASGPRTARALAASTAAHEKWARCEDLTAATVPARSKFDERFMRIVDPDGEIRNRIIALGGSETPAGRKLWENLDRRVEHTRKAYFNRLTLASMRAREAKKAQAKKAQPGA